MNNIYTTGIIGGGVSGAVTAIQMNQCGIDSILFEQEKSLVNGPPFCHLHAGGNLYPEISDEQCKTLMKQSIEMAKLFPQSIDERPTLIGIPTTEAYGTTQIQNRLDMLVKYYQQLITDNAANKVLGAPKDYYTLYDYNDLESLVKKPTIKYPKTPDEWMSNAIKLIDYKKLKTPIILVQEFGWNLFRLGAQAQLALIQSNFCNLQLNNHVTAIKAVNNKNLAYNWEIHAGNKVYKVKYLVNACGFKTGIIDNTLQINNQRLIEFKAAYIAQWQPLMGMIPELIFHGERGTPHGMAQLTPYADDYYQIHGMTEDITLFKNGLLTSTKDETQPTFNKAIENKLYSGWTEEEIQSRTEKSIDFIANFLPSFKSAVVGGKPLFGAQQIPGDDPSLRVGEVSFPCTGYARSEIIKASSALTVARQIIQKMEEEGIVTSSYNKLRHIEGAPSINTVSKKEIDQLAQELAFQRGYPKALSRLVIEKD